MFNQACWMHLIWRNILFKILQLSPFFHSVLFCRRRYKNITEQNKSFDKCTYILIMSYVLRAPAILFYSCYCYILVVWDIEWGWGSYINNFCFFISLLFWSLCAGVGRLGVGVLFHITCIPVMISEIHSDYKLMSPIHL